MKPISAALVTALLALPAAAQEWPRFRGPNGNGCAEAEGLPVEFGPEKNLRWKTEVPFARSSPVLTKDCVYLSASDEKSLLTLCLDRESGAVRWQRRLERARVADRYKGSDSATPSPVTDGANVYAFFQEFGLVSYDREGEQRWALPLEPFRSYYSMSSSPVLAGDLLLLQCDQVSDSYLLAVDKDTGKERWRSARSVLCESWCTPVLYPSGTAPRQVIAFGNFQVDARALETGKELWRAAKLGAGPVSSPILDGTRLIVVAPNSAEQPVPPFAGMCGYFDKNGDKKITRAEIGTNSFADFFGWADRDDNGFLEETEWEESRALMTTKDFGLVAFDLAALPEGETPKELWRYKRGLAEITTPIVYRGVLYMIKNGGILTALDPATGEVHARKRLSEAAGEYYPSPVAADGKLYFANNAGKVVVLAAGPDCEVLAVNDLAAELNASPAIGADGTLFFRTDKALYCFAQHGKQ